MTAAGDWDIVGPSGTDAELVLASAAGDRDAFAGIYDRYADRLHDFCCGILHDRDGAADCVQDVFCIAAVRMTQLREPAKLRPWLYASARTEALRRIRERKRETVSDELRDAVSQEPGPEMLAARTELAELVDEAAGGLSDRDREVLELTYRHGLDGADLADALGVSQNSANVIVHRLRETVERTLGALLVSRGVRHRPDRCAELAEILDGWDGTFTVLMRKRVPGISNVAQSVTRSVDDWSTRWLCSAPPRCSSPRRTGFATARSARSNSPRRAAHSATTTPAAHDTRPARSCRPPCSSPRWWRRWG